MHKHFTELIILRFDHGDKTAKCTEFQELQ